MHLPMGTGFIHERAPRNHVRVINSGTILAAFKPETA